MCINGTHKFQTNEQAIDKTTFKDVVQSELLRYKTEPSISVDQPPLHWWSTHQHLYPNVGKLARKYLCVVAISVVSEQLFSTADNVISVKRAALLPENVENSSFYTTIFQKSLYLINSVTRMKTVIVTSVTSY